MVKDNLDLLIKLISEDEDISYKGGSIPMIPELFAEAHNVVSDIIKGLQEVGVSNFMKLMEYSLAWSAYAGIGATALWNQDWSSLREKGISNALSEPRGYDEMDEYSLDVAGIGYNTAEGDAITESFHIFSNDMLLLIIPLADNKDELMDQFLECCYAMFKYGVIKEMHNLGMR